MTVPSIPELVNQERRARERAQYDTLILATVGVLPVTSMIVTYSIQPTRVSLAWDGKEVVLTSITVETSRSAISKFEGDANGWLKVTGHGRRAKRDGEVDTRARWEDFTLTPDLAAPLILAALTRTPVVVESALPKGVS